MNIHSHVKSLSISSIHHQPGTSHSAPPSPSPQPRFNNIHLGFFYLPVLRFYSNRPTRSSPLTTTAVPYLLTTRSRLYRSSLSHSVHLFLLDLPCAFYRSDLLFILSESPSPEQQRLHDNSSLILSAAICSFR